MVSLREPAAVGLKVSEAKLQEAPVFKV